MYEQQQISSIGRDDSLKFLIKFGLVTSFLSGVVVGLCFAVLLL